MRLRLSFQSWIFGGCLVVVLGSLIFVAVFLQRSLKTQMIAQFREGLSQQVIALEEVVADRWRPDWTLAQSDELADYLGQKLGLRVTLIAPGGVVLGDSEVPAQELPMLENHAGRPEVVEALAQGQGASLRYSTTLGLDLLYLTGLVGQSDQPRLVIRLAKPLAEVEAALAGVRRLIVAASLLGGLLSLGLAYLVARQVARPIKSLTRTARRIAAGQRSLRLLAYPANEVGELGQAFDQMADHLAHEVDRASRRRDRLEAILRAMDEGVLVIARGRIVLANQALAEMFKLEADPLGRTPAEALRLPELLEALERVLQGEDHVSFETRTLGQAARALEVHVVPLPGQGGRVGAVAVFHDVSERQRAEQVRRDFVANVSHELRTPLTAIRGSAETLLDGAIQDPDSARRFAEMIQRQAERLQTLAEDLLDLARLDSGVIRPERTRIDPVELIEAALGAVAEAAQARGIELVTEPPPDGLVVWGDRPQLEQALTNLLDNAVKYTEPGGRASLSVERSGAEVAFVVSDTGLGIEAEHLPRIFERFYRIDRVRSRELGGTGLGLAIVKHVVQAHGGRVEVASTPGRGSTFRLIISAGVQG